MEDESEAIFLKKLQNERDVIILKKLESCESFDDGEKAEVTLRFRNYQEALNELTLLRQEHSQLQSKMRKALSILYAFDGFSVDDDDMVDRPSNSNYRRKKALEVLDLIDDGTVSKVRAVFLLHRYLDLIERMPKKNAVMHLAKDLKTSERSVIEKLKDAIQAETQASNGIKPTAFVGVLPGDWPEV